MKSTRLTRRLTVPELPKIPDNPNFELWLQTLETGNLAQTRDVLMGFAYDHTRMTYNQSRTGYCCLGVACKIAPSDGGALQRGDIMLPAVVADWMGLGPYYVTPVIDDTWEDALSDKLFFDIDLDTRFSEILRDSGNMGREFVNASWLNDNGFTFPQIAGLIRYFGVKRITSS